MADPTVPPGAQPVTGETYLVLTDVPAVDVAPIEMDGVPPGSLSLTWRPGAGVAVHLVGSRHALTSWLASSAGALQPRCGDA